MRIISQDFKACIDFAKYDFKVDCISEYSSQGHRIMAVGGNLGSQVLGSFNSSEDARKVLITISAAEDMIKTLFLPQADKVDESMDVVFDEEAKVQICEKIELIMESENQVKTSMTPKQAEERSQYHTTYDGFVR